MPDFPGPVSCLVHVPPDTMSGILKNGVSLRCTCDIDWTTLDGCLGRPHEANNKYDAAVCMSSWLNAFSDDDTEVYVNANLENTDEYGKKVSSPKEGLMWKMDIVRKTIHSICVVANMASKITTLVLPSSA